jgi:two-component system NtrC family response regulator
MLAGQKVLIADDDISFCNLLGRLLSLEGYNILKAFDIKSAVKILQQEEVGLVLLDMNLPDGNGTQFTKVIKEDYPAVHVIILTAHADISSCVRSIKNGADDYILKGDDTNKLLELLKEQFAEQTATANKAVAVTNTTIEKNSNLLHGFANIIGSSPAIKKAIELGQMVANTGTSVLLLGETGTGKELFAKAMHNCSHLRNNPFVAINCAAFSKTLLESELFGYKAGAFTGAYRDKRGLIEEADGGTLFLDEIGELHNDMQAKLLRVLETGEFIKVGDIKPKKVNIRLISATNKDLYLDAEKGNFREDLLYRLNVFTIKLPALRERENDVVLIAEYFIKLFSQKLGKHIRGMTDEFAEQFKNYPWKGNIRELKNVVERAVILCQEKMLSADLLPYEILSGRYVASGKMQSKFDLVVFERLHIQKVLMSTHWNKTEAAKLLNISISTLYRKIEDYMLSPVE